MKRALVSVAIAFVLAPPAGADPLRVKVDQTALVKLNASPGSIIVGNPAVAGVALTSDGEILITGKKNGDTNIVVLDAKGKAIWSNEIAVRQPRRARVYPAAAS